MIKLEKYEIQCQFCNFAYLKNPHANRRIYKQNAFKPQFCFFPRIYTFLLSENAEMSMGEISKKINRDKSTTTVLIRKLIDEKLVKSASSSKDSRKKIISLTAEGKKYNNFTSEISSKLLSICYKNFSTEEKETILNLLEKMSANLETEEAKA